MQRTTLRRPRFLNPAAVALILAVSGCTQSTAVLSREGASADMGAVDAAAPEVTRRVIATGDVARIMRARDDTRIRDEWLVFTRDQPPRDMFSNDVALLRNSEPGGPLDQEVSLDLGTDELLAFRRACRLNSHIAITTGFEPSEVRVFDAETGRPVSSASLEDSSSIACADDQLAVVTRNAIERFELVGDQLLPLAAIPRVQNPGVVTPRFVDGTLEVFVGGGRYREQGGSLVFLNDFGADQLIFSGSDIIRFEVAVDNSVDLFLNDERLGSVPPSNGISVENLVASDGMFTVSRSLPTPTSHVVFWRRNGDYVRTIVNVFGEASSTATSLNGDGYVYASDGGGVRSLRHVSFR